MGWRITISFNKDITEKDIAYFVENLPENLSFPLGNSKQPWGWSAGVDIKNPVKNKIDISGSYGISGHIADEFLETFIIKMTEAGYTKKSVEYSW